MGSTGRLYRIDPINGACFSISIAPVTVGGGPWGLDFNPVADRLRLVNNGDENFRLNPSSGAIVALDANLNFPTPINLETNPEISCLAYSNPYSGASTSTLYAIDTNLSILMLLSTPNLGSGTGIAQLGVIINSGTTGGFDIGTNGVAYAALSVGGFWNLYTVDLVTGTAALVGTIGNGGQIAGIAVVL